MNTVWDGVVGQANAVATLRRAAERPAHAYLFVGPPGSTKERAARAFASILITGRDDADSRDARLVLAGEHPDVHEVLRVRARHLGRAGGRDRAPGVARPGRGRAEGPRAPRVPPAQCPRCRAAPQDARGAAALDALRRARRLRACRPDHHRVAVRAHRVRADRRDHDRGAAWSPTAPRPSGPGRSPASPAATSIGRGCSTPIPTSSSATAPSPACPPGSTAAATPSSPSWPSSSDASKRPPRRSRRATPTSWSPSTHASSRSVDAAADGPRSRRARSAAAPPPHRRDPQRTGGDRRRLPRRARRPAEASGDVDDPAATRATDALVAAVHRIHGTIETLEHNPNETLMLQSLLWALPPV